MLPPLLSPPAVALPGCPGPPEYLAPPATSRGGDAGVISWTPGSCAGGPGGAASGLLTTPVSDASSLLSSAPFGAPAAWRAPAPAPAAAVAALTPGPVQAAPSLRAECSALIVLDDVMALVRGPAWLCVACNELHCSAPATDAAAALAGVQVICCSFGARSGPEAGLPCGCCCWCAAWCCRSACICSRLQGKHAAARASSSDACRPCFAMTRCRCSAESHATYGSPRQKLRACMCRCACAGRRAARRQLCPTQFHRIVPHSVHARAALTSCTGPAEGMCARTAASRRCQGRTARHSGPCGVRRARAGTQADQTRVSSQQAMCVRQRAASQAAAVRPSLRKGAACLQVGPQAE